MNRLDEKQLQRVLLTAEAALLACCAVTSSPTKLGMVCYWTMVAIYHLSDYLMSRRERKA